MSMTSNPSTGEGSGSSTSSSTSGPPNLLIWIARTQSPGMSGDGDAIRSDDAQTEPITARRRSASVSPQSVLGATLRGHRGLAQGAEPGQRPGDLQLLERLLEAGCGPGEQHACAVVL